MILRWRMLMPNHASVSRRPKASFRLGPWRRSALMEHGRNCAEWRDRLVIHQPKGNSSQIAPSFTVDQLLSEICLLPIAMVIVAAVVGLLIVLPVCWVWGMRPVAAANPNRRSAAAGRVAQVKRRRATIGWTMASDTRCSKDFHLCLSDRATERRRSPVCERKDRCGCAISCKYSRERKQGV